PTSRAIACSAVGWTAPSTPTTARTASAASSTNPSPPAPFAPCDAHRDRVGFQCLDRPGGGGFGGATLGEGAGAGDHIVIGDEGRGAGVPALALAQPDLGMCGDIAGPARAVAVLGDQPRAIVIDGNGDRHAARLTGFGADGLQLGEHR